MKQILVARQTATIKAPVAKVWDGLISPEIISKYMFGTKVESQWKPGASITWSGEWQGKSYRDKGVILDIIPPKLLRYTYFSPLSGIPDIPENYRTITIELKETDGLVRIDLEQDNNPTEESRVHSEKNWGMMLDGLKQILEN
ncbi:MAG TPA: SRPBCC family protein [Cyclobacteriaceae bacterium]|nr:SRPBCC family protein [Cyclobacteriaceae bacterium]